MLFSNRDLRNLLIPLVIEQVLTALMGTVDTMMVTRVSSAAISGVSLVDSINKLVLFLLTAIGTGGSIICAQYLGHKDKKDSDEAARQVILTSAALSLVVTVFCLSCYKWLLRVIFGAVEPDVMASAVSYFRITIFGYPAIAIFGACAALYRAGGNSRLPMIISVSSNLLNIAGNAIFIFGFRMGAAGAALSTVICQWAAAVAVFICLCRPGQTVDLGRLGSIRPKPAMIWLVLCVGLPTGVENSMFQLGKLVVQSTVATLGTTAIAANAILAVLEMLSSMPSLGIGTGLVTVVGQCVGAGELGQARHYIKKLTLWSFLAVFVCNWVIYFLTEPVTRLAGMEPEAAALTVSVMLVISLIKPFTWPLSFTPINGMRAAGDVKYVMVIASISMWVFRVGVSLLLCRVLHVGLIGIWLGYLADWAFRSVVFTLRFYSDKWHSHKIIGDT